MKNEERSKLKGVNRRGPDISSLAKPKGKKYPPTTPQDSAKPELPGPQVVRHQKKEIDEPSPDFQAFFPLFAFQLLSPGMGGGGP